MYIESKKVSKLILKATCAKALELSFDEIASFARQSGEELIFVACLGHFFKNYAKSLTMEEFVKNASYKERVLGDFKQKYLRFFSNSVQS